MGNDQGIYHYIAWGLSNEMIPYVDTINMNWPGIIIVHYLARVISGSDQFGLRLLDIGCLFLLITTTNSVLRNWGVALGARYMCVVVYLLAYFSTGFSETAQRESFCFPIVLAGLYPWLANESRNQQYLLYGAICAVGLLIKPTPVIVAAGVVGCSLVFTGRAGVKRLLFFTCGALLPTIGMFLWLLYLGAWNGFVKWGIGFALGPYGSVKWPVSVRFEHILHMLLHHGYPLLLVVVSLVCVPRFKKVPVAFSLVMLLTTFFTVIFQGKTHLVFHYFPFFWALAVLGAVLVARKRLFIPLSIIFLVYGGSQFSDLNSVTAGEEIATALKPKLKSDETVVTFSFFPTLLNALELRTPFPYIDSRLVYSHAPVNSRYREELIDSLQSALTQQGVKFFVVEQLSDPKLVSPSQVVASQSVLQSLLASRFQLSDKLSTEDYDVYTASSAVQSSQH